MIRYASLCLVLFAVACGPSHIKTSSEFASAPDSADVSTPDTASSLTSVESDAPVVATKEFPIDADASLTPGVRCSHADQIRYPEKIAYCVRNVTSVTKRSVIAEYDSKLGYNIENMDRTLFKIDHYIPLCMGGDNARANLWPQHKEVFTRTDPIEETICMVLARGKLTQDESIEQMIYAKAHLEETSAILQKMKNLL
ncbi:MAG: hypothetical protein H7249_20085 [Chitinophagaceae bacterium]|nr:hypothetical protein [Oligoflexus sp.]